LDLPTSGSNPLRWKRWFRIIFGGSVRADNSEHGEQRRPL